MAQIKKVLVPDIGGAESVEVIEILVAVGDKIAAEDALITLEGDKATMDVPAPFAGVVESIAVKVGDKISENNLILSLQVEESATAEKVEPVAGAAKEKPKKTQPKKAGKSIQEVRVPDIGGAADVGVIDVMVAVGDKVEKEASLITLEGDKATMDVPSPFAGEIKSLKIKVGDKISEGDVILTMAAEGAAEEAAEEAAEKSEPTASTSTAVVAPTVTTEMTRISTRKGDIYASPAVRRIAREFDVDLKQITPSGARGRIQKMDLQNYVKAKMQGGGAGLALAAGRKVDFSKYGEIKTEPLSKINKASAANLHRNWVSIPHVTQFGQADITAMEAARQKHKKAAADKDIRLTPLAYIIKAVVRGLKEFPNFNASLDVGGENLILKQYFHVGVAVDTPQGLVVPVVRDADKKGLLTIAKELGELSAKARDGKLSMQAMQGGCFTITSLGGIGGTAFTPIINAPEVAILGVSRSSVQPVQEGGKFMPHLMLPLSLSYDHRVVDGADGARFMVFLTEQFATIGKSEEDYE